MAKYITEAQQEKLELAVLLDDEEYRKLLREYMGIKARAYTAYNYYDENGDFIGNSDEPLQAVLCRSPREKGGKRWERYWRLTREIWNPGMSS